MLFCFSKTTKIQSGISPAIPMICKVHFYFLILIQCLLSFAVFGETQDCQRLYLEADFYTIIQELEKENFSSLSLSRQLLLVECLARTAQGSSAQKYMSHLLVTYPQSHEVLAISGISLLSQGRIQEANDQIERALKLKNDSPRTVMAKATLLMFLRKFKDAEIWYEKILSLDTDWKNSYLIYLLGLDIYSSTGNLQALAGMYRENAQRYKEIDRQRSDNMKANSKLYKTARNSQLFQVEASSEKIVVPIQENPLDKRSNILLVTIEEKSYSLILDTGNSAGWIVHDRNLLEDLKTKRGGDTIAEIGTESGVLDGSRIYTQSLKINDFQINGLIGVYVPKPRPDFYDANLNPAFLRNRTVTIDFENRELVLKTEDKFDQDLGSLPPNNYAQLPWYGYKSACMPVQVIDRKGLAMIETGALDIGIKLEFAQALGLPLLSRVRYLSDGKEYTFFETRIRFSAGPFFFESRTAEVWPFERFYDRLTGYTADIYIGPFALVDNFSISFNPFDNIIVLEQK